MDTSSIPWITIALASLAALIAVFTMGLFGGNKMPVEGKTILITGASEGTGVCVAIDLAAKGANIIVVARNAEKLQNTVKKMQAAARNPDKQRFHYITADMGVPGYATGLVEEATRWNNNQPLDIVWSVAGFSVPRLLLDMPMQSLRDHMDVMFYGSVELSLAIMRVWLAPDFPIEEQPRHLILTTSVATVCPIAGYGPYVPSKAALRAFADTLAQELVLYPQNVKLHVVVPGSIQSEGMGRENVTKPDITLLIEESDPMETPEDASKMFIKGLEKGHYFVTSNWLGQLMVWGSLGASYRNNWVLDTLGMWLAAIVWIFARQDLDSKMRTYAKKHGHPATWTKKG